MSEAAGEVAPLSLCLDVDERGNLTSIDMGHLRGSALTMRALSTPFLFSNYTRRLFFLFEKHTGRFG